MRFLGKANSYKTSKKTTPLERIKRTKKTHPIYGYDIWNAYEVSFLSSDLMPVNFIAQFTVPCSSLYIFESKSLKLFLNSMNNMVFRCMHTAKNYIERHLSFCVQTKVLVKLYTINEYNLAFPISTKSDNYIELKPSNKEIVSGNYKFSQFRSNCLVTNQPDWGTVYIDITFATKISANSLYEYLCSFRNHNAFHESCIEMIYDYLLKQFKPNHLLVRGNFLRRGGIDITPIRSNIIINNVNFTREVRQ